MAHFGFCCLIVHEDLSYAEYVVGEMKKRCEKVFLFIPNELTHARLFGESSYYSGEVRERILKKLSVDEVFVLGDSYDYQELILTYKFDAMFYGSCFGKEFEEVFKFAEEMGVELFSLLPSKHINVGEIDALKLALENVQYHQKVVLFGTGTYFDLFMNLYGHRFTPAYAVDNDPARHRTEKSGVQIKSPDALKNEIAEDTLVVICAKNFEEIVKQLKSMGQYNYRLMLYNNPTAILEEYAIIRKEELAYLESVHPVLADMLQEFDRVCQKYKLHYYMVCGSLIGTVRHHGFIPWDDDVDVAMPRRDFQRLQKISDAEWDKSKYRLQNYGDYGNGAFLDCMPRMLSMGERFPMKVYDKVIGRASEDFINRPFIDIYVMDNAFDNQKKHLMIMNMMKAVYNMMMGHRGTIDYAEYRTRIPESTIKKMKFLHTLGKHIPLKLLIWWYDHLSMKANSRESEDYFMNSCAITCIERKFHKAYFGEGKRVPFLDFEVTIPSDYDGLMQAMGYHGYMQLPGMSIRKPSHYFNSDIIIW